MDIIVNTAEAHRTYGISARRGTDVAKLEMDVNYFGLLRLAQEFGPALRARSADGETHAAAWVNVLSVYALSNFPPHGTFSASKAAALSLAQCLRAEMRPAGIRVINAFPGPVDDEWNQNLPPPKLAPAALASSLVKALKEGIEDVYPGDVAQEWLERWRDNPKVLERELARNLRLTAIRSFFRFVSFEEPAHSALIQRVLAIPSKRHDKREVHFLTHLEIEAILAAPDRMTWLGRRDHTLLLLAVQTGLRLSELIGLDRDAIHLDAGAHVRCVGKGRKERCTPLTRNARIALQAWLNEPARRGSSALFPNLHGGRLSAIAFKLFWPSMCKSPASDAQRWRPSGSRLTS
ncbi:short chain dehydrogenase [Variovorax sp. YR216]|nr:short chain dehydrogenase [Variovorax sp. YR216]